MPEGAVDDLGDFRHALEDGRHPARGECVKREAWGRRVQALEQDLGHDGVADPGRSDDQGTGCGERMRSDFWQNWRFLTTAQWPLGASPENT